MPTEPTYTFKAELAVGSMTDLSSYCQRASYSRSIADIVTPLRADEGLFDLVNDASSLSPLLQTNLKIGRKVSFEATYGGSSYNLYAGRIKSVATKPILGQRTTLIEALNDVDRLGRKHLDTGMFVQYNAGSLFTEIMSLSSVNSFIIDTFTDIVDFAWYRDKPVSGAIDQLIESGNYQSYMDGAGTFNVKNRYWSYYVTYVGSVVDNNAFDISLNLSDARIINKVLQHAVPRAQSTTISTLAYLAQPISIPASSGIGFFVTFVDPRDSVTPTPVGSIVTLVSSQDYYGADNSDGTGTNRTANLSLTMTAFGETAVASLFNGIGTAIWLSRFQVRGYPILSGTELSVKIDNASSQNVYGLRERSFNENLITSYTYLRDLGNSMLTDYSEPRNILAIQVVNEFPMVLDAQVGHPMWVVASHSGVNSSWNIRRMQHDISLTRGLEHSVGITLEKFTEGDRPLLILDNASLGLLDSGRQLAL